MKVLLIGFTKIKYMPYMNSYLDNIDRRENDISLLYWNRDLHNEDLSAVEGVDLYEFRCFQKDDVSKLSKIKSFIKYRNFGRRLLVMNDFDFIIVMHSLPAILIKGALLKKYAGRYIFDYRDATFEHLSLFRKQIAAIQRNAKFTFVSSDGFREFFPESEQKHIFTSHNLLVDSLEHRTDKELYGTQSDKIKISFWGFIRGIEINIALIDRIGQDQRFELHYYGREQEVVLTLKQYVRNKGYSNVVFHGEYIPKDRYEFIKNTDLIHNVYDDDNMRLAMGNKYYDGIIFRIPQLGNVGGFMMAERASRTGVGITIDPYSDDCCDVVFNYYRSIDFNRFYDCCDIELNKVMSEFNAGNASIREIFSLNNKIDYSEQI